MAIATQTAQLAAAPDAKKPRKRRIVVTAELFEKVRILSATVHWQGDIAAQTGLSRSTVGEIQRKLGINPRRSRTSGGVKIIFTKAMLEMAKVRSLTVAGYLAQLADADRAEHRRKAFCTAEPTANAEKSLPIQTGETWRTKVNPVAVQRILYLLSEGMNVQDVARRIGCSTTTVRRIRAEREAAAHVPSRRPRRGVVWGDSGGGPPP